MVFLLDRHNDIPTRIRRGGRGVRRLPWRLAPPPASTNGSMRCVNATFSVLTRGLPKSIVPRSRDHVFPVRIDTDQI